MNRGNPDLKDIKSGDPLINESENITSESVKIIKQTKILV